MKKTLALLSDCLKVKAKVTYREGETTDIKTMCLPVVISGGFILRKAVKRGKPFVCASGIFPQACLLKLLGQARWSGQVSSFP